MINENPSIRKINRSDMPAIIELLQFLSEFKPLQSEYSEIWNEFNHQNNVYAVVAVIGEKIVGYGSIVVETKIRGGKMGHIEDIVSHTSFRKRGIGKAIIDALLKIAKEKGCYKVALQCKKHNILFYEKCDYEVSGVAMQHFI